ncbi:hypothetical protein ACFLUJ_01460 [Chloroflexota bacterium]
MTKEGNFEKRPTKHSEPGLIERLIGRVFNESTDEQLDDIAKKFKIDISTKDSSGILQNLILALNMWMTTFTLERVIKDRKAVRTWTGNLQENFLFVTSCGNEEDAKTYKKSAPYRQARRWLRAYYEQFNMAYDFDYSNNKVGLVVAIAEVVCEVLYGELIEDDKIQFEIVDYITKTLNGLDEILNQYDLRELGVKK